RPRRRTSAASGSSCKPSPTRSRLSGAGCGHGPRPGTTAPSITAPSITAPSITAPSRSADRHQRIDISGPAVTSTAFDRCDRGLGCCGEALDLLTEQLQLRLQFVVLLRGEQWI